MQSVGPVTLLSLMDTKCHGHVWNHSRSLCQEGPCSGLQRWTCSSGLSHGRWWPKGVELPIGEWDLFQSHEVSPCLLTEWWGLENPVFFCWIFALIASSRSVHSVSSPVMGTSRIPDRSLLKQPWGPDAESISKSLLNLYFELSLHRNEASSRKSQ